MSSEQQVVSRLVDVINASSARITEVSGGLAITKNGVTTFVDLSTDSKTISKRTLISS